MSSLVSPELVKVVALLATSVTIVPLFKRIGLGSVLGYLVAGCFNWPIRNRSISRPCCCCTYG